MPRKWINSAKQTRNNALRLVKANNVKPNLLVRKLIVTSLKTGKNSKDGRA